ncbi:MAG TPA: hypothetical protein DCR55_16055, partial [Lentisphaeria bacterium]|nr:hypothetical protein [Lentisphaeria bacterium]
MDRLYARRLTGIAQALSEQRATPSITGLAFEERLSLLVDRQYQFAQDRALANRLRYAGLSDTGPPSKVSTTARSAPSAPASSPPSSPPSGFAKARAPSSPARPGRRDHSPQTQDMSDSCRPLRSTTTAP